MRRLLIERFNSCCQNVFAFRPNFGSGASTDILLRVRSREAGCCVGRAYHVAPVVQVRVRVAGIPKAGSAVRKVAIDPSLFDRPVLLNEWLSSLTDLSSSWPRAAREVPHSAGERVQAERS